MWSSRKDAELAFQQVELHEQDDDGVVDQHLLARDGVVDLAEQAADVLHVGPSHDPEEPVLDNQELDIVDDEGVVVVVVKEAQSLGAGLAADFQDGGSAVPGGDGGAAVVGPEEVQASGLRGDLVDVEDLIVSAVRGRVGAPVVLYLRHDVALALRVAARCMHSSWLLRGSAARVADGELVNAVPGSELAVWRCL
jgi:hypothetical protein